MIEFERKLIIHNKAQEIKEFFGRKTKMIVNHYYDTLNNDLYKEGSTARIRIDMTRKRWPVTFGVKKWHGFTDGYRVSLEKDIPWSTGKLWDRISIPRGVEEIINPNSQLKRHSSLVFKGQLIVERTYLNGYEDACLDRILYPDNSIEWELEIERDQHKPDRCDHFYEVIKDFCKDMEIDVTEIFDSKYQRLINRMTKPTVTFDG